MMVGSMDRPGTEPGPAGGARIRPATRKDREEVVRMSLDLIEEHRRDYGSDVVRSRRTERLVRRNVRAHIRRGAVLVAEVAGRPSGFVLLSMARFTLETSSPAGSVTDLYVEPELRGRGVGTGLLSAGLDWLRGRGYRRVLLNVTVGNPARRLYEKAGFIAISESMEVLLD
jgi:GNAT superfamily N-acetyltransferase